MRAVLGLPLRTATARLEAEGISVTCREIRCRKGSAGSDARVIAQLPEPDGGVTLLYARFLTAVEEIK